MNVDTSLKSKIKQRYAMHTDSIQTNIISIRLALAQKTLRVLIQFNAQLYSLTHALTHGNKSTRTNVSVDTAIDDARIDQPRVISVVVVSVSVASSSMVWRLLWRRRTFCTKHSTGDARGAREARREGRGHG